MEPLGVLALMKKRTDRRGLSDSDQFSTFVHDHSDIGVLMSSCFKFDFIDCFAGLFRGWRNAGMHRRLGD